MHCDPRSHPRHKHRIHTKRGAFNRLQSDFQKKKIKKSTDQCSYELLYVCIYLFISCLCERKKKG